jgi:hypothetical protein
MGWFKAIASFIGIAVATVLTAGLAAPIGAALIGAEAAAATIGATTVGEIVGGSVIGSGLGAISAGIQGGNVVKGLLTGAVSGGVGTAVSGVVGGALGAQPGSYDPITGKFTASGVGPTLDGSKALGAGATKAASGFAGSTAGSLAGGQPIGSALKSGLIGGVSGGLSAGVGTSMGLGSAGQGLLGGALSYGLGKALQPTGQSQQTYVPTQTTSLGATGTQTPGAQTAGASSSLGSALFAAPGIGYSPGGPILGGSGGEDKAPKNVWSETDKSLRDVGSTVT